jgi:tetratricopeptide (TPR) repeat protein
MSSTASPGPAPRRRLRWTILVAILLLAAGLGAAAAYRALAPSPPPLDLAGVDPQVVKVITEARDAVRSAPRSAAAWGRLGMVLSMHEFTPESHACLERAEELDAREPRWPYYQGLSLLRTDPERALDKLRRAADLAPAASELRLALARALLDQGRFDEAEEAFDRVLEDEPDSPLAHLGLGRLACERDRPTAALPHLGRAAASPYTRKAACTLRLSVDQRQGNRAAVDADLGLLATLPDDAPAPAPLLEELSRCRVGKRGAINRATALLARNQVAPALDILRQAVQDYPDAEDVWRLLGRAQLMAQDAWGAEQSFRTALRCAPGAVESQFYLGVALFRQGRHAEALPCFREVIRLKPDHGMAYFNEGLCLEKQEEWPAALEAFRAAVRCLPHSAQAHQTLGEALARAGRPAEAAECLQRALQLKPGDTALQKRLDSLGRPKGPGQPSRPGG